MPELKETFAAKVKSLRDEMKEILEKNGEMKISDVTVSQAYGGMRGVKCLVTETSALDPMEGIRYRGLSIPECRDKLPKAPGGDEPLPEGLFYLLLTGALPSDADVQAIQATWRRRETLPAHVSRVLDALPKNTHPMTQFSIGIMALQRESVMAKQMHGGGINKADLWQAAYEDAMNLLARLPLIAAYVYRRTYKSDEHIPPRHASLDWAANFGHMLGYDTEEFAELMRLYMVLHADHEGGNVSAHTVHLVGSALSDPYLALAAGMNGLAGPLHGLASQEVVEWVLQMRAALGGGRPTREKIEEYSWNYLSSGKVIPGYGHAVLRQTDPRYTALKEFAQRHLPDDDLVQITAALYDIVPPLLTKQGKAKNPWPNVDAHSGVLLMHYDMVEHDFYTVLFGVSRAMGTLASFIVDRALGLSIERPKSVTTEWIKQQVGVAARS